MGRNLSKFPCGTKSVWDEICHSLLLPLVLLMILLIWFCSKVRKCLRSTASPLCQILDRSRIVWKVHSTHGTETLSITVPVQNVLETCFSCKIKHIYHKLKESRIQVWKSKKNTNSTLGKYRVWKSLRQNAETTVTSIACCLNIGLMEYKHFASK